MAYGTSPAFTLHTQHPSGAQFADYLAELAEVRGRATARRRGKGSVRGRGRARGSGELSLILTLLNQAAKLNVKLSTEVLRAA